MRLTTSGISNGRFNRPIVGRISREPLPLDSRRDVVFLGDTSALAPESLLGYRALISSTGRYSGESPGISAVNHEHLLTGDIVALDPSGFVRTLYRPASDHNIVFATGRCNSNCLMCSQPPKDVDDTDAMVSRNLELIRLIDNPPKRLVITGGEPTLLGERLFTIIEALRDKFPTTYVHMLSNGRTFAWPSYTAKLAALRHPDFMLGIPVYSDDPVIHDYGVQAKGAFDQTVLGIQQLARFGLRVEIRVVLHAVTIPRLAYLAEYIYRNLTFAEHVALMGLENIGYAPRNMKSLWIDPADYQSELEDAVEILSSRGMNVSIYNHQLCVLRRSLWKFSRKSISDWKNIYLKACDACQEKDRCGGFFQWADKLHSAQIRPLVRQALS